jgi:hypothetical protein
VTRVELRVLRAQLLAERARLADVVVQLEALQQLLGARTPTIVELMAAAGFVHNLYNGMENCLSRLAHGIDESVPRTGDWHRLLLDQLSAPIEGLRPALLGPELAQRVDEYRRFRHAFRHMYYFDLDWVRLRPLLHDARGLLVDFERAIDELFDALGPAVPTAN